MITINLPYPHLGQRTVMQQSQRFNWLAAGRRWRKTTLGLIIAVNEAIKGKTVLWGAPTFDQVRIAWKELKHATNGHGKFTQQTMTAELPSRGMIIFRSLDDPDNARGHTADGVIMDECGDVKEEAWYEVLRPTLIDTNGWLWALGTPKGRNWFWREHLSAIDKADSISWQIPTLGCLITDNGLIRQPHLLENPDIPFSEIESIYNTVPLRVFEAEILSQFLEGQGAVFRNIQACLHAPITTPEQHSGHRIVAGLDWAKQSDFTATSLICVDCAMEVHKDRFNQIDYHFQRDRLTAIYTAWNVAHIEGEANSIGEPNIEELQRDGLPIVPFMTTATSKPPLIESLALCFEKVECQFQNDPIWTGELEAYEIKLSQQTGRSSYSAPTGLNDDTVIARSLAWRAAIGSGEIVPIALGNW